MMSSTIIVNFPVGVVTGILTSSEFILSLLATIAGATTVRGAWLVYLHRWGRASVTAQSRSRRLLLRDFVSFAMGIWLVASVSIVERNFEPTYVLSKESKVSPRCLRMDQPIEPALMDKLIPPVHLKVDQWIFRVSQDLQCENGIATVGLEGERSGTGTRETISAPVCSTEKVLLNDMNVVVRAVKISSDSLRLIYQGQDYFELFPYVKPSTIEGHDPSGTLFSKKKSLGECSSRHIGGPPLSMHTMWSTLDADGQQVSNMILYELCRLHGNNTVATIDRAVEDSCRSGANDTIQYVFDPSCIGDQAKRMGIDGVYHTVKLENMSIQLHYNERAMSFACVDSAVQVHYVFVSAEFLRHSGLHMSHLEMSVIVPVGATVISGHCERTLNVLGRAALLFTADSEWRKTFSSRISRVTRYHANMMAISTSLFPLDQISDRVTASSRNGGNANVGLNGPNLGFLRHRSSDCRVRIVKQATGVVIDRSFYSLVIATAVCSLLVVMAAILRLTICLSGYSWTVGSAKWALMEFAKKEAKEPQIVVQPEIDLELAQGNENFAEALGGSEDYAEEPSSKPGHSRGGSQLSSGKSLIRSQTPMRSISEGRLVRSKRTFISRMNYELTFIEPDSKTLETPRHR